MAGLVPAIHGLRLEKVMATGRRHPRRSRASTVQLKQAKQVRHDDHNGVTTGTTGSEPRRRSRRVLCGFVVSFVMNLPAVRPGSGFAGMNTSPNGAPALPTHTLSFRPIPVVPCHPVPSKALSKDRRGPAASASDAGACFHCGTRDDRPFGGMMEAWKRSERSNDRKGKGVRECRDDRVSRFSGDRIFRPTGPGTVTAAHVLLRPQPRLAASGAVSGALHREGCESSAFDQDSGAYG